MELNVYLSGEIHTDWRQKIIDGCKENNLSISFSSAVTDHEASDSAGDLLGKEEKSFWRDHKSAKVNAIRTKTLIENCDVAIIRFGEKYKQWNAAFDAGLAVGKGIPIITLHSSTLIHPLKEIDAAAIAVAETPKQVIDIVSYILQN